MALFALASVAAGPVTGDWFTEKKDGVISIRACGASMCGEISGVSDWRADGSAPRDSTGVSECHLRIIRDMRPGEDGKLEGTITDPRDGEVYHAKMWRAEDGTLRLRGYVGIPLLGSTQTWTKFTGRLAPDCHFTIK